MGQTNIILCRFETRLFLFIDISWCITDTWGQPGVRVQLPVLVNRGWVPASMRNEALAHEKVPSAEVKEVLHETKKLKQDSWWGRWSKPPVAVQVKFCLHLSLLTTHFFLSPHCIRCIFGEWFIK